MHRVKKFIAFLLTQEIVGSIIARLFNNRIPAFGIWVDTRSSFISNRIRAKLFFGIYESAERRFVKKYLPYSANVIELGASIGVLTTLIRRSIDPDCCVVAVEANPNLIPLIFRNLALNNCEDNVFVKASAISYSPDSEVSFNVAEHSTDGRLSCSRNRSVNDIKVPAVTLSRIILENQVKNYCIVCDIEGEEWKLFEFDLQYILGAQLVIIELHDSVDRESWTSLLDKIVNSGKFLLVDQYGSTCVLRPICRSVHSVSTK